MTGVQTCALPISYIVGGHTASGYWVNTGRETTVKGLYAAGDVAGGCPQKYVTGALAEGKLAALDMVKQFKAGTLKEADVQTETEIKVQEDEILSQYEKFRNEDAPAFSVASSISSLWIAASCFCSSNMISLVERYFLESERKSACFLPYGREHGNRLSTSKYQIGRAHV